MGRFPTTTDGLAEASRPIVVDIEDGDVFELEIAPVRKTIGDSTVRMLAYGGSVPGPTLRVTEGSTVTVRATNRGDVEATMHWHGLRLENQYDGTHETQAPIPIGETFTYELHFPDPGVYWYHPHIREDYAQELGLYGNILVVPADSEYWPPADREVPVTLDDILIEDGEVAGFAASGPTHVAMGRFGNVMLISGESDLVLSARCGEVVRFFLTNTANARVFNVVLPSVRMKLVGADAGRYEREEFIESALVAPSERVVVDVLFDQAGDFALEHRTPERSYRLAAITVSDEAVETTSADSFSTLRTNADMVRERERIAPYVDAPPDKTLAFVAEMDMAEPEAAVRYTCPMHPEVTSEAPGHCPKCGMKLLPADLADSGGHGHDHEHHAEGATHDTPHGIEWEDDMVAVNRMTTSENMRWKLVDVATGAENAAIDWRFQVGDQVKLRLVNEMDSDHPMPHPFHIHGAGRFLILGRDGVTEENLVWKDTVLVRTGETVDILLDVTNPGRWMAHCHIAEHHEGGMMLGFLVEDAD
jgi:FtsP/CotA-like multicopper oxidase with cupredoxin domain